MGDVIYYFIMKSWVELDSCVIMKNPCYAVIVSVGSI